MYWGSHPSLTLMLANHNFNKDNNNATAHVNYILQHLSTHLGHKSLVRLHDLGLIGYLLEDGGIIIDVCDGDLHTYLLCSWPVLTTVCRKHLKAV